MKATASYARQNFAALLERAIAGEEVIIERHGRQVARLLPAGSVQGAPLPAKAAKVAEVRGVDPRSPLSRVLRKRAIEKLQIAHPRAQSCVAELVQRGAKVRIVGSMARGSFRQTSDVDIYIEDPGPLKEAEIEQIARRAMRDFPFDLIYAHKLAPGARKHFGE